jgi:uncharacterized membrane protein
LQKVYELATTIADVRKGVKMRTWQASFLTVVVGVGSARATEFQITPLSAPTGTLASTALDLNNYGELVGQYQDTAGRTRPIAWGSNGYTDLFAFDPVAQGSAHAINDNGMIVGTQRIGDGRAFIAQGGKLQYPASNNEPSGAWCVNNAGTFAGDASVAEVSYPAISSGATLVPRPELGFTQFKAINDAGVLVATVVNQPTIRSFVYDHGTTTEVLAPAGYHNLYLLDINDDGQTAGFMEISGNSGTLRAVVLNGESARVLNPLPGHETTKAFHLNSRGDVVGVSHDDDTEMDRPVLWIAGSATPIDLQAALETNPGWTLTTALDINDFGKICGDGIFQGRTHAFLMTPTPEPVSAGPVLVAAHLLARRRARRTS